jgi:hypothetical protein
MESVAQTGITDYERNGKSLSSGYRIAFPRSRVSTLRAATLLSMIAGFATAEGTARYCSRFSQLAEADFFRRPEHVPVASELAV